MLTPPQYFFRSLSYMGYKETWYRNRKWTKSSESEILIIENSVYMGEGWQALWWCVVSEWCLHENYCQFGYLNKNNLF